ncbi:hypothetical protein I6L33_00365 [Aeromonas sp. FDAARGOS 1403]|uniref:hypothetical protein n=1 Tax=Aeromonas TaxID=642 RepID=UPI001C229AFA|nr:hypothetical protein [Aeromonas sp. FDAARGOS 1403]QXA15714.1 hypothetical protein I6L33_00365 [Aeromonas sp. FDAARGOS 1403]
MQVSPISELEIRGVFDRGHPNLERIGIYVHTPLNIGQYGIMLGIKANVGFACPIRDNLFWFGDGMLNSGDWIFIYTGAGVPQSSIIPGGTSKLYSTYWGKPTTVFHTQEIVPMLFRADAVQVPIEQPSLLTQVAG